MKGYIGVNPLDCHGWDDLVLAFPNCNFFHSRAWASILMSTYHYSPRYLVSGRPGDTSVFPLMDVRSRLMGHRGVSLPFADECGPLLDVNSSGHSGIVGEALSLAAQRRWKCLEIHGEIEHNAFRPYRTFIGHAIRLDRDLAAVSGSFRESTRRNIKKAQREGVEVHLSTDLSGVRLFYRLHVQTRKRQGVPVQTRLFFDNIHAYAISRGLGSVVLARYRGKIIAGALYLHFGRTALYKFGASLEDYKEVRPSNLVMWEAIQHYHRMRIDSLSLGRTDAQNLGLLQYKNGWGCEPRALHYFRWDSVIGQRENWGRIALSITRPVLRWTPAPLLRVLGRLFYSQAG